MVISKEAKEGQSHCELFSKIQIAKDHGNKEREKEEEGMMIEDRDVIDHFKQVIFGLKNGEVSRQGQARSIDPKTINKRQSLPFPD